MIDREIWTTPPPLIKSEARPLVPIRVNFGSLGKKKCTVETLETKQTEKRTEKLVTSEHQI